MAQNISLLGASYPNCPAVLLPKTGGGTATFTDVTDTTAAAGDVASGKYFYTAAGVKTQGTASGGGGGASNIVTGTFKGTTTNTAMEVTLSYSGSGYPIAALFFPNEGAYNANGSFGPLVQRYAYQILTLIKNDTSTSTGNFTASARYKSQAATSYTNSSSAQYNFIDNTNASASTTGIAKLKTSTKLSVFIAGTSYGFAANIEYKYVIIYSS